MTSCQTGEDVVKHNSLHSTVNIWKIPEKRLTKLTNSPSFKLHNLKKIQLSFSTFLKNITFLLDILHRVVFSCINYNFTKDGGFLHFDKRKKVHRFFKRFFMKQRIVLSLFCFCIASTEKFLWKFPGEHKC